MASFFNLFKKRKAPLACVMSIDQGHTHTQACYVDIMPLSVVELFQSQGCASCPPAIPLIQDATNNPNLLLLTYDVTYWNPSSKWEDTFGSTLWDARQRQYLTRWGRSSLFTPQIVVDGVSDGIGATKDNVNQVVMKAMELRNGMAWALGIDRVGNDLRLASEVSEADMVYDVLIVVYDPVEQTVKPRSGPNKSKKIPHRNVVRELMKIGEWNGGIARVALPDWKKDGYERVALVQGGLGGPIIAALKL
ncbi:Thioredoxin-like protein [Fonsecaea pedrosoi]|nr:Thioredoxin-like protein [Fonsecaea pedrosoi]